MLKDNNRIGFGLAYMKIYTRNDKSLFDRIGDNRFCFDVFRNLLDMILLSEAFTIVASSY